jgi:low temperature requirement protein LtrA
MAKSTPKKAPFLELLFLLVFVLCLAVGVTVMYTSESARTTVEAMVVKGN